MNPSNHSGASDGLCLVLYSWNDVRLRRTIGRQEEQHSNDVTDAGHQLVVWRRTQTTIRGFHFHATSRPPWLLTGLGRKKALRRQALV